MHLLNDKSSKGLGIQIAGGRDLSTEGKTQGIFVSHIMDKGAAAKYVDSSIISHFYKTPRASSARG